MKTRAALLGSLATITGLGLPVSAATPPAPRFAPADHTMIMTRTVWRSLADGRAIRVARQFRIAIERSGTGYRVRGTQIGVEVDAPPQVAMLADVERRRDESGLFPLLLDSAGHLVEPAAAGSQPHPDAVNAARADLLRHRAQHAGGLAFVTALAATGVPNRWPDDLFSAPVGERSETRAIPLPGGAEGSVTVTIRTTGRLPCGLPAAVEREVLTRAGDTARTNRERWSFTPLTLPMAH